MTDTVIIVDNNMLSQLHAAGGQSAWDTLLNAGDRVILTPQVIAEAGRAGYSSDFDSWLDSNIA